MTAKWYNVCGGGQQLASRVVVPKARVMKKYAIAVEGDISDACCKGAREADG